MTFKFLGLVWDMKPLIGMIWAFTGLMLIGASLLLDVMGWWMIAYLIAIAAYLATAESVSKKL